MSDRTKRPLAACLACVLGLALLASLTFHDVGFGLLDARIARRLRAFDEGGPGFLATAFAHLGDPLSQVVLAAVACAVAIVRGRPRLALAAFVIIAGSNLTTQILKDQAGFTSFPSGHATAVAATAYAFLLVLPRRWRPAILIVGALVFTLVGCSVVVLHRHFPSDVAGGALIASAWFFATVAVCRGLGLGGAARRAVGQRDVAHLDIRDRREDGVERNP